jgi:hypothetical protein
MRPPATPTPWSPCPLVWPGPVRGVSGTGPHPLVVRDNERVSDQSPHVFVQWKGTDVCLDLYCACGTRLHFDGYHAYELTCGICNRVWELPAMLPLKEVTGESDHLSIVLRPGVEDHPV